MVTLEQVLDIIAEKLIVSEFVDAEIVRQNQKTIFSGIIYIGRAQSEDPFTVPNSPLLLYEKDEKAHQEDLVGTASAIGEPGSGTQITLVQIIQLINNAGLTIEQVDIPDITASGEIFISWAGYQNDPINITSVLSSTNEDGSITNPLNISQFLVYGNLTSEINPFQAEEFLDTNIYELLPDGSSRQSRITRFFQEFENLTGEIPDFDITDEGFVGEDFSSQDYSSENDISFTQENPDDALIDEEEAYITRLDFDANNNNEGKTLESLRDRLNNYLVDIDEELPDPQDLRPTWDNKSEGYLKFRQLNQGIIIRNTAGKYIDGLNPHSLDYLVTGFTITMWVRFLDRKSTGTLFNFGNPTRQENRQGFKLDTLVSDDFKKRYLRLVVYDPSAPKHENQMSIKEPKWFDSHIGKSDTYPKRDTAVTSEHCGNDYNSCGINPSQYTEIPADSRDWYFIVATYDPNIIEVPPYYSMYGGMPYFWMNHFDTTADEGLEIVAESGYGNRSKVDIISRSDLIRARGFQE